MRSLSSLMIGFGLLPSQGLGGIAPHRMQAKLPRPRLAVPLGQGTTDLPGPGCCPGPATAGETTRRLTVAGCADRVIAGEQHACPQEAAPKAAGCSFLTHIRIVYLVLPAASLAGRLLIDTMRLASIHIAGALRISARMAAGDRAEWPSGGAPASQGRMEVSIQPAKRTKRFVHAAWFLVPVNSHQHPTTVWFNDQHARTLGQHKRPPAYRICPHSHPWTYVLHIKGP